MKARGRLQVPKKETSKTLELEMHPSQRRCILIYDLKDPQSLIELICEGLPLYEISP